MEQPDYASFLRKCNRWYSEKFSTSLPDVEKLSEIDILRTWFEVKYEELAYSSDAAEREEYARIKEELIVGEKVLEQRTQQAQDSDDAWAQELIEGVKKDWENKDSKKVKKQQTPDKPVFTEPVKPPTAEPVKPPTDPNLLALEESFSLPGESSGDPNGE